MSRVAATRARQALRDQSQLNNTRHKRTKNDTMVFSHTTVSSSTQSAVNESLASLGPYNDFAVSTRANSTQNSSSTNSTKSLVVPIGTF